VEIRNSYCWLEMHQIPYGKEERSEEKVKKANYALNQFDMAAFLTCWSREKGDGVRVDCW
jgi:hypothetical protein